MGDKAVKVKKEKAPKTSQNPKAPKTPKAPRQPAPAGGGQKKGVMIFSIRNKIIVCFLVPILFMIAVGISAYQKAAEGMSEKFTASTIQTINMATEYVDMSCSFIESEAMTYAFDKDLSKYFIGIYNDDPMSKMKVTENTKTSILASQTANAFISHIHIITKDGINMFSTAIPTNANGFSERYLEAAPVDGKRLQNWIDGHDLLDEELNLKKDDYILAYEVEAQAGNACVVIDIKAKTIREFIKSLDLGTGSIVGFVTENGLSLIHI